MRQFFPAFFLIVAVFIIPACENEQIVPGTTEKIKGTDLSFGNVLVLENQDITQVI
jgi:hypothetical protein